jgi:hypothetical protein
MTLLAKLSAVSHSLVEISIWSRAMKILRPYLVMLILSGCVLACSMTKNTGETDGSPKGDYQYTSFDSNGRKVVEGRLSITSAERRRIGSEETIQLKGNWELKKVGNQEKIGAQVGTGELTGSIENNEIYINLNPNIRDGNVILRGTFDSKGFHGRWTLSIISGVINQGRFEAIKK